ncbi:Chloride transport protein 6 (Chloride channel protein 6) (ClC-6), partial [Durusdinium trenchii]
VLFALEEGASFWSPQVLLQALFCSSVSALTLNFFLGGFDSLGFGTLGALGVLTFGSYFQSDATSYRIWELPFFFGVGILGGLVGATFNALNVPLTIWRQWCVGAGGTRRFFEVMTVTAVISTAFVFLPAVMRQCVVPDVISDQHGDLKLICDASSESRQNSIESALGLFMTPSEDAIKVLFHDPAAFHPLYLALFAALYFFMACWTYGLGVPSGLFVPSLLTGAALGRLLGEGLQAVCSRGQGGPGLHVSSPGVYALVGAAASLGGMARITISLAVILVEATGNTQFSIPIIFAVLTSKAVGDCFNRGIYDIHIHLKKLPFLEAPTEVECHKQLVSSVMTQDVRTVFPVESVARLKDLLGRNSHGAFPVVDSSSSFRFQGMLSRSALQSALQAQVGRALVRLEGGRSSMIEDIRVVPVCGLCTAVALLIFTFVAVPISFKSMEQGRQSVILEWMSQSVSSEVVTEPGISFVGFGNYLIEFPATFQAMYFIQDGRGVNPAPVAELFQPVVKGPIRARSADGLEMQISVSLQWRLRPSALRDLYNILGENLYKDEFVRFARAGVIEACAEFAADEYFTKRAAITARMSQVLQTNFAKPELGLSLEITGLQLREVDLPDEFDDEIENTQEQMQE